MWFGLHLLCRIGQDRGDGLGAAMQGDEDEVFAGFDPANQKVAVEGLLERVLFQMEAEDRQPDATEAELFGFVCTCLCNGYLIQAKGHAFMLLRNPGGAASSVFSAITLAKPETREGLWARLSYTKAHRGRP